MGIKESGARFLCAIKRNDGVDYAMTCMLGRQEMLLKASQIKGIAKCYAGILKNADFGERYCEGLLQSLGAQVVDSLDASPFEQANIIWDLNQPIEQKLYGKYTCVIDGGTSEHIFNFPIAIFNAMKMVRIGGHYVGMVPSNNWNGHGLYQFSPMLFIQLFCKENGFKLEHIYFAKSVCAKHLWELKSFQEAERTEINGFFPEEMYIVAKKVSEPKGAIVLQQGDYCKRWEGKKKDASWKLWMQKHMKWETQSRMKYIGLKVLQRRMRRKISI